MSFPWRQIHFAGGSRLNETLEKEDVTLHKVLEHEEYLNEVRKHNPKLIDFIQNHFEEMIDLITKIPKQEDEKIAGLVFKTFNEIEPIITFMRENITFIHKILGFLCEERQEHEYPIVNFCSVILNTFFAKFSDTILESLQSLNDLQINGFLKNIGLSPVLDLFDAIIAQDIVNLSQSVSDWFIEVNIIEKFLDLLNPQTSFSVHDNIYSLLSSVVSVSEELNYPVKLMECLRNDDIINHLLSIIKLNTQNPQSTAIKTALRMLIEIVRQMESSEITFSDYSQIPSTLQLILNESDSFNTLLTNQRSISRMKMTFGEIIPLGFNRLYIVELIASLYKTNYFAVHNLCLEHRILENIFNLFFEYQWNNLLHGLVESILEVIFSYEREEALADVISSTQLFTKLSDTALRNQSVGSMGSIRNIASFLIESNFQTILCDLENNVEWDAFMNGVYVNGDEKQSSIENRASNFIVFPDNGIPNHLQEDDFVIPKFLPEDNIFIAIPTGEFGMEILDKILQ